MIRSLWVSMTSHSTGQVWASKNVFQRVFGWELDQICCRYSNHTYTTPQRRNTTRPRCGASIIHTDVAAVLKRELVSPAFRALKDITGLWEGFMRTYAGSNSMYYLCASTIYFYRATPINYLRFFYLNFLFLTHLRIKWPAHHIYVKIFFFSSQLTW